MGKVRSLGHLARWITNCSTNSERGHGGEQVGGQENEFGSRCVEYERPVGHPGGVPIRNIGLELSGEARMGDNRLENHE